MKLFVFFALKSFAGGIVYRHQENGENRCGGYKDTMAMIHSFHRMNKMK